MDYLIDAANHDPSVREVAKRASEFPSVQGIVIEITSAFLTNWRAKRGLLDGGARRHVGQFPRPIDMYDFGDVSPYLIKVCVLPWPERKGVPALEDLRPADFPHALAIEARTQAVLAANPRRKQRPVVGGLSIGKPGSREYGTLGVILDDGQTGRYAITCAHVVDQPVDVEQPSAKDSKKAEVIGRSVDGVTLKACPSTMACNPWSGVIPNHEDIALIKLDSTKVNSQLEVLDIGPLNMVAPRASLSTSQDVEVVGRTTRHSYLEIGGLAAWYRFSHNGQFYCFQNLFEVRSPYGNKNPIRAGDSGAPVVAAIGGGNAWCGMIVGCDQTTGYAMYAELIRDWWMRKGYSLRII